MFRNPLSTVSDGKFFLGLILITPGFILQCLWPSHSLYHDFSSVFIMSGFAVWMFSTYLFVPLLLLTASAIFDLIPQVSHQVSHTVTLIMIALAVVIGLWGWWRERQTEIAQKKLN